MEKKKIVPYPIIAGIMFAICALLRFEGFILYYTHFTVFEILWSVVEVILAVLLILKRRDIFTIIPCAIIALLSTIDCIWTIKDAITESYLPGISRGLIFLAYVGLLYLMAINFTPLHQQYREKVNKYWFAPAAIAVVRTILVAFNYAVYYGFDTDVLVILIVGLPVSLAILFCAMWVVYPNGIPYPEKMGATSSSSGVNSEAYCSLLTHILLLLFTCGIWFLIWVYRVTGYTNSVKDEEERNPVNKLLLCIFVPFYQIYWTYKTALRVDKMAEEKGMTSELSTLCLILAIFVPLLPPILLQDKLNNIVTADTRNATTQTSNFDVKTANTKGNDADIIADELKTYKELLDNGILTQEEFDAKKKQILRM